MGPDVEKYIDFDACRCGSNRIYIKSIYQNYTGKDLFIAECQDCGEFVPFIAATFYETSDITKKAIKAWNSENQL